MAVAALIAWLLTAVGGFYLLATWIAKGGTRAPRTSHFPPGLIFGHFALTAVGLVVWIVYLVLNRATLSWVAFAVLIPVALLGFLMFARWLPTYRARAELTGGPGATGARDAAPAERHFPVALVAGHGLLAVVTVVLVLLTALRLGVN
jgi:hypothetical protein